MANDTYGAIKLSDANAVGSMLVKKMGGIGYAPKEWADVINLMGKLPEKTVSGGVANCSDGADDVPVKEAKFYFLPKQASGTPSPSSPLAIDGWTVLTAYRQKKNLLDMTIYDGGTYNPSVGVTINLTTSSTQFIKVGNTYTIDTVQTWRAFSVRMPIKDGITYYRKFTISASGERVGSSEYYLDESNKVIGTVSNNTDNPHTKTGTITIPSGAVWFVITFTNRGMATNTLTITEPQIEVGSSASTYEAYQAPTSYPVTWQDSAGTLYGGYVDAVRGKVVKTHFLVTLNVSDMDNSDSYPGWKNSGIKQFVDAQDIVLDDAKTTIGDGIGINTTGTKDILYLPKALHNNLSQTQWQTNYPDLEITIAVPYKESSYTEYDIVAFTPNTYYGSNNFYNDCGDSEVTYRRDIDLALNSGSSLLGFGLGNPNVGQESEE